MHERLIDELMNSAYNLKKYKNITIPQVFTISEPSYPFIPGFVHEPNDWVGSTNGGSSSYLENSDGCIEVLKKIKDEVKITMYRFTSLYPDILKKGQITLKVGGLDEIVADLKDKITHLEKMIQVLGQTQSPYPKKIIDMEKLRKLYNTFVVAGIKISENNWNWPEEFKQNIKIKKDGINVKEMEMINESLSGVLAELASSDEIHVLDDFHDDFKNMIF